ncbi:DUF1003 domain-containing protein [Flavobacterium sp. 7A]|uniref:DUF1003 domain-containing protein n=1 Tax=Flavobacterium sp. 7A TaxID=2940571 RepID=UPI0022277E95|nr:DUF1003 domain-containing protein [Flavobacterium sp. 7A]MCW2118739.1 putative membrane protein [Flavobacterium sp. 7A]
MKYSTKNIQATKKTRIEKLQEIVKKTVEEETLITENLTNPPEEILTRSQKISDKVASFGGSWAFIISFFVILTFWIVFNVLCFTRFRFDPYPFILMNLILSCIAALQAPVIMMSQNRQEEKDRKRSENDYLINLKSELEIRALHDKIDILLEEQIKILFDSQTKQLRILESIQKKLKP